MATGRGALRRETSPEPSAVGQNAVGESTWSESAAIKGPELFYRQRPVKCDTN